MCNTLIKFVFYCVRSICKSFVSNVSHAWNSWPWCSICPPMFLPQRPRAHPEYFPTVSRRKGGSDSCIQCIPLLMLEYAIPTRHGESLGLLFTLAFAVFALASLFPAWPLSDGRCIVAYLPDLVAHLSSKAGGPRNTGSLHVS